MNKCKCGKEWGEAEKLDMPGTPDKPVSGFHFQFKASTKLTTVDEEGKPIHPFDRSDMKIVSCPECKRSLEYLANNEFGAAGLTYVDGGGKIVEKHSVRRAAFPFFEEE